MDKKTESELVKKATSNVKDFAVLFTHYYPRINNFVYHRIQSDSDKDEIVSNVFFNAMNNLTKFRFFDSITCGFSSWLYRIAINEISTHYRRKARELKISARKHIDMQFDDVPEISNDYELVKKIMKQFSMEDQNLLALKYFEKLSYKELSEIFKKSEGALKVRVHRLLNQIRDHISEMKKEIKNPILDTWRTNE
ncbi:MAG: sigma-70 family RNA polymerase sigma factor [Candidatus Cloacimonetes bacterium]|nr:sigma-70 family RNA polymerase sigma factor [Candidatus Cloacimonadota bacterium]